MVDPRVRERDQHLCPLCPSLILKVSLRRKYTKCHPIKHPAQKAYHHHTVRTLCDIWLRIKRKAEYRYFRTFLYEKRTFLSRKSVAVNTYFCPNI